MYKCPMCKKELKFFEKQIGVTTGNVPIIDRIARCQCGFQCKADALTKKKEHSTLSVVAIVLSVFTVTAGIGFIIALIDLGINDKTKKHLGSWFSIIYDIFIGIGLIAMIS